VILRGRAGVRLCAALGGQIRVAVPKYVLKSALAQRCAYPALGELVLADDALCVDPKQYVDTGAQAVKLARRRHGRRSAPPAFKLPPGG